MPLANVVATRSGTGWTIDVTAAQLSANTAEKDFTVLHAGIAVSNVTYTKTTQTVLTYTGAALPSNTSVEIRRKTSFDNSTNNVTYASRFSTSTWNNALQRIQRWEEEVDLNGAGTVGAGVIPFPANDAYGAVWTNDTIYPPTRKALWDKFELMAPLASPTLTGVPTAPTNAGTILNTSRILTHYDAQTALALKADLTSPALLGSPTAPTQTSSDNSNKLATTAFVKSLAYAPLNSPTISDASLTGTPTAPTVGVADSSTKIATTAHVKNVLTNAPTITSPTVSGGTFSNPTLSGSANSTSYGGISTGSDAIATHSDVKTGIDNRFLVHSSRSSAVSGFTAGTIYSVPFSQFVSRNIGSHFDSTYHRLYPQVTGWYYISGSVSVGTTGGTSPTEMRVLIAGRVNDTTVTDRIIDQNSSNAGGLWLASYVTVLYLTVGTYWNLTFQAFFTGGTGFSLITPSTGANIITVKYLGA